MTGNAASDSGEDLLLAYYGDDFTGSTDALEGLALNGVRTVLFVEPPIPEDLARFDDLDAVGVAGTSRSMSPAQMDEALPPVYEALADLGAPLVHYKVCSTFDSAPEVGSIGRAIDLARETLDPPFVPVSQGTESPFGRYVVFGNLFAVQDGVPYRIDRHPTMAEHPTTPMREADLRRHLGEQTDREVGLVDVRAMDDAETAGEALDAELAGDAPGSPEGGTDVVVLDALEAGHLHTVGELLWERATAADGPLFAVGSSGLEHHALPAHWDGAGAIPDRTSLLEGQPAVDQIAVVSGSASPVTADQIDWAAGNGFATVRLETTALVDPETARSAREEAVEAALAALDAGESVVLFSARGPDDPAIAETEQRAAGLDLEGSIATRLGREQGRVFAEVVRRADLDRGCVAGGDTSGYVVPELDSYALDPVAATEPGAPLCRVRSRDPVFDGFELTLKGGQTGTTDYFGTVLAGGHDGSDR
ncbi:MAG: four-carbon acid sugar kinase family protein [Halobacteriaceae archaeon]